MIGKWVLNFEKTNLKKIINFEFPEFIWVSGTLAGENFILHFFVQQEEKIF